MAEENYVWRDIAIGSSIKDTIDAIEENFNKLEANDNSIITELEGKLSIKPDGQKELISDGKINLDYIPDSISTGAMTYAGDWKASETTGAYNISSKKSGYYWIASDSGKYLPDGNESTEDLYFYPPEDLTFNKGDWAIWTVNEYGFRWTKIDNSDLVTSVNGRIGAINTYQGAWNNTTTYRKGDIITTSQSTNLQAGETINHFSLNGQNTVAWLAIANTITDKVRPTLDAYYGTDTIATNLRANWFPLIPLVGIATTNDAGLMSATDKSNLDANTTARHSHTNKEVLDATEESYTTAEKNKLAGITAGANNYSHPAGNAASKSSGLYKFSTDSTSHIKGVTAVAKADITALGIPGQDTTYDVATESTAGLMSAADKTKLNDIDDTLLGVTADDIGKVKDVTVDGESVLGTDGIAAITIDDLEGDILTILSSDTGTWDGTTISKWGTYSDSSTTYYAIQIPIKYATTFEVYSATTGKAIVTQNVITSTSDGTVVDILVGTSKDSVGYTLRKIKGGAVSTSGSSNHLYQHIFLAQLNCDEDVTVTGLINLFLNVADKMTTQEELLNKLAKFTWGYPYTGTGYKYLTATSHSYYGSAFAIETDGTIEGTTVGFVYPGQSYENQPNSLQVESIYLTDVYSVVKIL